MFRSELFHVCPISPSPGAVELKVQLYTEQRGVSTRPELTTPQQKQQKPGLKETSRNNGEPYTRRGGSAGFTVPTGGEAE